MKIASPRGSARALCSLPAALALALLALLLPAVSAADDDIPPPPPSVGTTIPPEYFAPMPSDLDHELLGPVKLLRAGTFNADGSEITLPLYKGKNRDGKVVWYILTDTTDSANADALGLNFSGKLAYSSVPGAFRRAVLNRDTSLTFDRGSVNFRPDRSLKPGKNGKIFPPRAQPGSVGDRFYSPIVRIMNVPGTPVYNAPVVAFDVSAKQISFCNGNANHKLVADRVAKICPKSGKNGGGTVTLKTTPIFSFGRPALYISMEASDAVTATLDNGTFAPAMKNVQVGRDDGAFSAVERLFVTINGPMGADNPQRQGLESAIVDKGPGGAPLPPLQVIGGIPTLTLDYSPLWDLNLGQWTKSAIANGYRSRLIDEFQLLSFVAGGFITGPNGKKYGSTGIIVNCPIVFRFL